MNSGVWSDLEYEKLMELQLFLSSVQDESNGDDGDNDNGNDDNK